MMMCLQCSGGQNILMNVKRNAYSPTRSTSPSCGIEPMSLSSLVQWLQWLTDEVQEPNSDFLSYSSLELILVHSRVKATLRCCSARCKLQAEVINFLVCIGVCHLAPCAGCRHF